MNNRIPFRIILIALALTLFASFIPTHPVYADGGAWYAAPDGSSSGDGTDANPWDLQTALTSDSIQPGDTLWLRGGRYGSGGSTTFKAKLNGEGGAPIVVRSHPGEWATVDGSIESHGKHTWFWGFEVTNSMEERHTAPSNRPGGLNLYGTGSKVINMVIHNTGHPGIGLWEECGDGSEVYGTLIYGVGLYDATTKEDNGNWTRGSAIYAQNKDGSRMIAENITFRNFTTGMKAYTEGGYVNGFKFHGNVLFMNNDRNIFASGRDNPARGLEMIGNMTYRPAEDGERSLTVGYPDTDQEDAVIKDNYIVNGTNELGALYVKRASNLTVTGNTLVSSGNLVTFFQADSTGGQNWDGNRYYGGSEKLFKVEDQGMGFDEWKAATGFDGGSSYEANRPVQNAVFVRPNQYEAKRANIVVYNWENADSVGVDLSGVLQPGDPFRIVDAQNFFGEPVVSGTYEGGAVSLPMRLGDVAPIIGELKHFSNTHTPAEFNVFVLLPN